MQINNEYWGGTDKTETYVADIKRTSYLLRDALNNGDIPFNEQLDLSISPWAINKKADILNICYGFSHRVGNSGYVHATPKFYPIHDFDKELNGVPFYFMTPKWNGNSGARFDWYCRNGFNQSQIVTTGEEFPAYNNYRSEIKIIRDFDYSKFVYMARIYYATNAYTGQTMSDADFNAYASWDYSYFFQTDEWINNHPIIGIRLTPYYKGADSNYPDKYRNIDIYMNTLGYQKPMTEIETNAETGYNIPFIDNFMTLVYNGYNGEGLSIGMRSGSNDTGSISIQDNLSGIPVFDSSYEQNANWILSPTKNSHMIPHSATYENAPYSKWVTTSVWNGTSNVLCRSELRRSAFSSTAEMQDYVFKQIAYLGTWFTFRGDIENLTENTGESDKWFLGEIDENGVTTGNYRQGTATADFSNSTWENPWNDSPYQGRPADPTPYDTTQTSIISTETGDPSYGTKEYLMSENAVNQLVRVLNELKIGEAENDIREGYCETAFGDTDPMKSIISVIKYPFDIKNNWNGNPYEQIVTGSNVGQWFSIANAQIAVSIASELPVTPTLYTIDLTSAGEIYEINWNSSQWSYGKAQIPYFAKFKNFLDYEPYCTASLYVPFCGSVKLDPEIYVGHDIGVTYILSPLDGTIKALIMRDNLVIDTLTGNMGNTIEINSSDELAKANNIQHLNATIQAQKMNTVKKWSSVGVGIAGGAVVGGGVGAVVGGVGSTIGAALDTVSSEIGIEQKKMDIETAETPFKQLQSGGGFLSSCDEYAVRLVIYRPETLENFSFDNWHEYGHLNGFATYETGTLENYAGYTECAAANLDGISATSKEKEMIFKFLKGGVYI